MVVTRLLLASLIVIIPLTSNAQEMTFILSGNGGNCNGCEWVAAQGEVSAKTPDVFASYIEKFGNPYLIVFNSEGGNLVAGVQLGRMIRAVGASTAIGKTQSLSGDLSHLEEITPGICASACAFAFMGGVERSVGEKSLLGVHQFYSISGEHINSELVQRLVGITLLHTIDMGIDPSVIVAASGTSSLDMYWISQSDLVLFGLDTSVSITDAWRLEPYKNGLVLTITHHENSRRSVDITIFCRANYNTRYMLISEKDEFYARQLYGSNIIEFPANQPKLHIAGETYSISTNDIERQQINGDLFSISIRVPHNLEGIGGKRIGFDPDLARVYNSLLSAYVTLPENNWLEAVSRNCI